MELNIFEAHITADIAYAKEMQDASNMTDWKYSQIHGCHIMGNKTYCYLTYYNTNVQSLKAQLDAIVAMLESSKVPVLRAKIEQIIYDTKTGIDKLSK